MRYRIELINGTQLVVSSALNSTMHLMYELIDEEIPFLFFQGGAVRKEEIAMIIIEGDEEEAAANNKGKVE